MNSVARWDRKGEPSSQGRVVILHTEEHTKNPVHKLMLGTTIFLRLGAFDTGYVTSK